MAENISFRVCDVRSYQSGIIAAVSHMDGLAAEIHAGAESAYAKADAIFAKIENVLAMMQEDRRTAEEVRQHNEEVLRKLELQLEKLRRQAEELRKAYSRAYDQYRAAAAEETRIHNSSVPSTGDSEEDKRAEDARSRALTAAHNAVRAADRQLAEIRQAQSANEAAIQQTQADIDTVTRIIRELTQFISQIQTESARVEQYRNRLERDVRKLKDAEKSFRSAYEASCQTLEICRNRAEMAVDYGMTICRCLDPDDDVLPHDECYISFTDVNALGKMSRELSDACESYEDAMDEITERTGVYENTMQDNVISQGAELVGDVCQSCIRRVNELQKTARLCKEADIALCSYYNLSVR